MKVAIVHDWLTGMRGGEYVLEAILDLFPEAHLFTLIHFKGRLSPKIESRPIRVSPLQRVPGIEKWYRHFLPVMPALAESFDLSGYDVVVSSSHCVAKGIRKPPGALHVAYLHAPMRYVWDQFDNYFGVGKSGPAVRFAARCARPWLQAWDRRTSTGDRVDGIITNSRLNAERIRKYLGRESVVVHPFADSARFDLAREPGEPYLMVGALAPNRRVDLAIEAFRGFGRKLRIVGTGQDEARLRAMAGPETEFLGALSNEEIALELSRCRAFLFPGVEDFGITAVEALSAGAPVIAYGRGSATEILAPGTGVLFWEASAESLRDAVLRFEAEGSLPEAPIRAQGRSFHRERFLREFRAAFERFVPIMRPLSEAAGAEAPPREPVPSRTA